MDAETIRLTLQTIGNFLALIVIPAMTVILISKIYREYKETNQLNIIRCYIMGIFAAMSFALFWANLQESTTLFDNIPNYIISNRVDTITLYSIGIGLMVTLALSMTAYANRWETLYYTSFFVFGGFIIFYLLTGFVAWFQYFIYISAILGLTFFYITGVRLKDNGSLGLGVFFTFAFVALILGETILSQLFNIGFSIFAVIFVFGYFRVFKEENLSGDP